VQELSSGNARSTARAEVIRPGRQVTRSPQLGQHPVSAATRFTDRNGGTFAYTVNGGTQTGHRPSGFRSANNDLDAPQPNAGK
jgi:hypothetical protein